MEKQWKFSKRTEWLIHLLAWSAVFLMPYIFNTENEVAEDKDSLAFRNLNTVTNFLWMGLFYINAYILIPSLLYKKKYVLYPLSLLVSFVLIMLIHGALFIPLVPGHDFNFYTSSAHNIVPFLFTIMVSTTYKIIYDKLKADTLAAEIQKENLKTELSFLRSQISPHFLFNVLNNIVAMVRIGSSELEPTVIRLSSLLQYMLYETDEEKVLLRNEVDYLKDYIDLQRLRFSSKLIINASFDIQEPAKTIEPMLLIPFIENAFKHGIGLLEIPEINISLSSKDNLIDFQASNRYLANDMAKDKTSGIGLTNVKRRLELLYPGRHELNINSRDGWFFVHLKLFVK